MNFKTKEASQNYRTPLIFRNHLPNTELLHSAVFLAFNDIPFLWHRPLFTFSHCRFFTVKSNIHRDGGKWKR